MARFTRLFVRKQAESPAVDPADAPLWSAPRRGARAIPRADAGAGAPPMPVVVSPDAGDWEDDPYQGEPARLYRDDQASAFAGPPSPADPDPLAAPDPAQGMPAPERRAGALLIGGDEEDIVPIIPDTAVEFHAEGSAFDEEASLQAAIDALMAACTLMVARVRGLRSLQDGTQIVAGLIALAGELDARYAADWGVVRRNGLELVLNEVRDTIPEGDQFILESLEDGQGGLTAESFLRDLRTIAAADRPRMVANYAGFLIFVLHCVLRQYLTPLQPDPARLRDVAARLEYLIEGIRDTVLARIRGIP